MSQLHKGIFGALALALTLGAAQFAAGQDLVGKHPIAQQVVAVAPETGVNRAAKTDRAAVRSGTSQTRTVALPVNGLADTSVLIRLPVAEESRARPAAPSLLKPGKTAVACEPMVSVLTEVAKLLQPGRCVT